MSRRRLGIVGMDYTSQVRNEHTYWKLKELIDRGARHHLKSKIGASNMRYWDEQHLYERMQRGLLLYQTCKTNELRAFCAARNVSFAIHRSGRESMIYALEAADEGTTFESFLELPPELREQIYTHHLQDLETVGFPREPPITRASRLLQQESLPLFYDICKFEYVRTSLFQHCPNEILGRLRSLTLHMEIQCEYFEKECDIHIGKTGQVEIKFHVGRGKRTLFGKMQEIYDALPNQFDLADTIWKQKYGEICEGMRKVMKDRVQALSIVLRGRGEKLQLSRGDQALFAKLSEDVDLELDNSVDF